jgi:hypothetical protein
MPDKMPAEMRPAKAFDRRSPQMSKAIRMPSSRFVYQHESKKMAPGKKGASMTPKKNRTVRSPAGELVAPVQPLTIAHAIIQDG